MATNSATEVSRIQERFDTTSQQFSVEVRKDTTFESTIQRMEKDPIYDLVQTPPVSTVRAPSSFLRVDDADIPAIDLQDIYKATGARRKELVNIFGDGLRDVGFIAVKVEEDLVKLIEKMYGVLEGYFSQPMEVKMLDWQENSEEGYSEPGRETAAGATQPDAKETVFIPPGFKNWPKYPANFEEVVSGYRAECENILKSLMEFVAEYLNEPTEDVSMTTGCEFSLLRLAHYFALTKPIPWGEKYKDIKIDPNILFWSGEHTDLNGLTILPPGSIPGLQLRDKNGNWKNVNIDKGYLIINVGEQLEMKTGGLIKATPHRVVNPGGEYVDQDRYAFPFFGSWSKLFNLYPFKSCVEKMTKEMTPEQIETYMKNLPGEDTIVHDNLMSRLIELRTIRDPSKDLVQRLLENKLLRQCPKEIKEMHADVFSAFGIA